MKTNTVKTSTILSTLTIIAALLFTITPSNAFGSGSSPNMDSNPDPAAPGSTVNLVYSSSATQGPHKIYLTRIGDANVVANVPNSDSTRPAADKLHDCAATKKIDRTLATDGDMWELRDTTGDKVVEFVLGDTDDSITVPFGSGVIVTFTENAGSHVNTRSVVDDGLGGETVVTQGKWVNITPTGSGFGIDADNTNELGLYSWESCGEDKGGPVNDPYERNEGFVVIQPVGGIVIPIQTTSLILAGISTSGIWLLPALTAIVGSSIAIYKIRSQN